ncbi:cellulase [Pediococcus acidilactici NGRI 0510Q]|uniref:Cellulase family glycosylhydrolase n=1 Tax=Pediococcus acidilactici TaxID=1254 RepID=A0AAW8YJ67_PEDAC|nr:cellulase family glycosylhydrolase [Pediococcus acidilactici]KRN90475.1 hypothetical protein IV82_GL001583 [Pediococcus acidilactici]MDV2621798.1 cellulase family glycosylhydrolase [Pediococcus acidilactici]QQC13956.1 cellulase family glycosylhydrolase [Pediococcus acidilactici]GAC45683.1 cellulase [Pediococcus acidilactici NGRI 0510Q]
MEFIETKNKQLFFKGKELKLRGLGIGTWLNIEHFMIGLPGPQSMILNSIDEVYGTGKAKIFLDKYVDTFINEKDFAFLKEQGINFIRVPINHRLFMNDNTLEYNDFGFLKVKKLLDFCEKYKIFCMLDMHTAPGGQNPDWHSDNRTGVPEFWQFKQLRNQLVSIWTEIAKRFGDKYSYLLGYDLLNEPAMAGWKQLNEYFKNTTEAIRKYDQNHAIILESNHFAMDFTGLESVQDNKTILSFHYYPTVWKQNLLDKDLDYKVRKREFAKGLEKLLSTTEHLNYPLICGEAGYDIDPENVKFSMDLLKDTIDIFEEQHVSWCLWAYKDACFMGLVHPDKDSKWMHLVKEIHKRWTHYEEMNQANEIVEGISEMFGYHNADLEYESQFRIRGILYRYQQESILIPLLKNISWEDLSDMIEDFSFDKCNYYTEYVSLLRHYLK